MPGGPAPNPPATSDSLRRQNRRFDRFRRAGHDGRVTSPNDQRPTDRRRIVELLKRYNRPAPRYTSYPTAVEFDSQLDAQAYDLRLSQANQRPNAPLSIYVHLPFCAHRCLFCGCHVIITPHHEKALPYLDLLKRETKLVAERLADRRTVSQLHLGGGTPTYYRPEELRDLLEHLGTSFERAPGAEYAVEVDPRVTTEEHVDALADLGFNRISLGVQDFTPEVQEAIERVQSFEETQRIVDRARARGYQGINIDLIYGLPHQTLESFEKSVESVIAMGADRTAVYSFAFVPWIRQHMHKITDEDLPTAETKLGLFALARQRFLEAGYEPIGMDHFAKPDDELARARREGRLRRNFQGYTVIPAEDVVGLGISAIGDVAGAYVQNAKKLSTYGEAVTGGVLPTERGLARTADDDVRRHVIHELMCNAQVVFDAVEARHNIDFRTYFAPDIEALEAYAREGLAVVGDDSIHATPTGELFIRNLALCFDRYYREKHQDNDRPVFSQSV